MYTLAHLILVASFLCSIVCAGFALYQLFLRRNNLLRLLQRLHYLVAALLSVGVFILLLAFARFDFSVEYVAQYSDRTLPLFYRLTALWAGQAGSLLFWAWAVAASGVLFSVLPAYRKLTDETKLWYWVFFPSIMAFFLVLLTGWSNPFIVLPKPPQNGLGLNPLLQNPGMIFHPPLLFLGYGGFVIPGCLALAQAMGGNLATPSSSQAQEAPWAEIARIFILAAWLLLSAGIILGAWWAYMELGWGGYWAWDPVENASLIPWLAASAYLHTAIIEKRLGKLKRFNVFLMALTTISAFFATYLVRSGIIQSLHAYPDGGVGLPLLCFIIFSTLLATFIPYFSKERTGPITAPFAKEGLLSFVAWIFLALSCIILIATLWPVFVSWLIAAKKIFPLNLQELFPQKPMGLEPIFYNKTCLPLLSALACLLVICPFRRWKKGWKNPTAASVILLSGLICLLFFRALGIRNFLALLALSASCTAAVGITFTIVRDTRSRRNGSNFAAHGVHFGFLLMVMGVALSGPYQTEHELVFSAKKAEALPITGLPVPEQWIGKILPGIFPPKYTVTLKKIHEGESSYQVEGLAHYHYLQADLLLLSDGRSVGELNPQIRLYASNPKQTFREVDTIFSLGNELYATFSHIDSQENIHISLNINPLVNWLWIGGTLLCLSPLLNLCVPRKRTTTQPLRK